MKPPCVSVIMPVFNAERYLSTAIESVQSQTFSDFEFIIIDDGSTDGSASIISYHARADPRLKVRRRSNTGYVVALNEALGLAAGQYIARMDADDVCMPDRFRKQVDHMSGHPTCVAVGCAYIRIDSWNAIIDTRYCPVTHSEIEAVHLQGLGAALPHPGALIRSKAINSLGGYRSQFEPAEDYDLWLRLGEVGELNNVPVVLLKYRVHSGSTSMRKLVAQQRNVWAALREARQRRCLQPLAQPDEVPAHVLLESRMTSYINSAFYSRHYITAIRHLLLFLRRLELCRRNARLVLKILAGPLAWHALHMFKRIPKEYITPGGSTGDATADFSGNV